MSDIKSTVTHNRIVVKASLEGWCGDDTIVILNKLDSKWHVGSSMCLPSDEDNARIVVEAYKLAFLELDIMRE